MAVEDHPKYPEWRAAQDAFIAAEERYDEAVRNGRSDSEITLALKERDKAQTAYNLIASQID